MISHVHVLEKINIVKMFICKFNAISIKIPMAFFMEMEKKLTHLIKIGEVR